MSSDRTRVPPNPTTPFTAPQHLASWYTPGFSDGLGSRLLMFDNTAAPSWELLRLRPDFVAAPDFEQALRSRVDQLATFRHPSFARVRSVEDLGAGSGLALVSTHVAGRRLSEALERPRSAGAAISLVRQIAPALAALHQHRRGLAHGMLTPDRIVLASGGRFIIRDFVLASAVESLEWSAAQIWVELGVIATPAETSAPKLDARSDVVQMGLIAMSLMLGRRVDDDEYPEQIGRLFERVAKSAGQRNPAIFLLFRTWLERALRVRGQPFETAQEAADALRNWDERSGDEADFELPSRGADADSVLPAVRRRQHIIHESTSTTGLDTFPIERPTTVASRAGDRDTLRRDLDIGGRPGIDTVVSRFDSGQPHRSVGDAPTRAPRVIFVDEPPAADEADGSIDATMLDEASSEARSARTWQLAAAAATLVAAVEAAALTYLLLFRPGAPIAPTTEPGMVARRVVAESETAAPTGPANPVSSRSDQLVRGADPVSTPTRSDQTTNSRATPTTPAPVLRVERPPEAPKPSGQLRVLSPIDLQVFEGTRLLGSTRGGSIEIPPGRHELSLVNRDLRYSARRVIEVVAGKAVSVNVTPGNGSVNINATPWAEVWLNGASIGVTPLARVSVPLGEHEFVFRHPQLGERRQKARVRSGDVTLVTISLGS